MSTRITISDLERLQKEGKIRDYVYQPVKKGAPKRAKFGNKKTVVDGITFDSKKEANRYFELKILRMNGEISDLKIHEPFKLSVCTYEADFTYLRSGKLVVEDVKSAITKKQSTYRLKKKLMAKELNIEIQEV